jgi:hypothetical protein
MMSFGERERERERERDGRRSRCKVYLVNVTP